MKPKRKPKLAEVCEWEFNLNYIVVEDGDYYNTSCGKKSISDVTLGVCKHRGCPYCGIHNPIKRKAKQELKHKEWQAKYEATQKAYLQKSRRENAIAIYFKDVTTEQIEQMNKGREPK